MKIEPFRVDAVLQTPGSLLAILLYGDDAGLIRSRADQLTRGVAGSLDDTFRVASLERESHDRLTEEASAIAMTGGRRVVRVREAGDGLTAALQAALALKPACLIVLEAPGLASKSRLRILAEAHDAIGAIGCYPEEGRNLEATIRGVLTSAGVGIDRDALRWVVSQLGADQALTRREVEKLALYCSPNGTADLAAAQACVGDAAAVSMDDALFAATEGNIAGADRALAQAMAEGSNPVGVLRATLLHLQRLHRASLVMAGGQDVRDAVRSVRPPLFARRQGSFQVALELWRPGEIVAAVGAVFSAEQGCKRTGAPAEAICAHTILGIARRSAQLRRLNRG